MPAGRREAPLPTSLDQASSFDMRASAPRTSPPSLFSESIADLPRLLYLGDIPVLESFGGMGVLFRLLSSYPTDRLYVLESNLVPRPNARELPGVPYSRFRIGPQRVLFSRLSHHASPVVFGALRARFSRLPEPVRS